MTDEDGPTGSDEETHAPRGADAGPSGARSESSTSSASSGSSGSHAELEPRSAGEITVVEGTVANAPADPGGTAELAGTVGAGPVARMRRDARVSRPPRHPQWMINQLPVGMLGSDFFVRFMGIFQELSESLMDDADQLDHVPDVSVTPTPLLAYLASWIDVRTVDPSLPEQVQRAILRSSATALALRGTKRGLEQYLRMLSDGEVAVEEGGGVWPEGSAPDDVAWLRMTVSGTGHLSEGEFATLIRDEIPAHVRAELYVADRRVWSTEEER